jgi:hypothetical protein
MSSNDSKERARTKQHQWRRAGNAHASTAGLRQEAISAPVDCQIRDALGISPSFFTSSMRSLAHLRVLQPRASTGYLEDSRHTEHSIAQQERCLAFAHDP